MTQFQPPRGTRDLLPEEMIKRQFIVDTARSVFEKWGFDPLDTPAFEEFELLTAKSGQAIKDEIYYFKDKSDRELGLRFDFTVPAARVISSNPNLQRPFRRYQLGPVWRYDRPGAGRYREFWQADIDIFGSSSIDADAEVVACACEALQKIGISNFYVRINNRKIMNAFLGSLKLDATDIMRSIDKLNKIGDEGVREELKSKKVNEKDIDSIIEFTKTSSIEKITKFTDDGVKELEQLVDKLKKFNVPVRIDTSLVRGLEYYTGSVFEIMQEGSSLTITAGGRYDNMIEGFGGKSTPAVGISLGVDRLMELVQLDLGKTRVDVYIANVDEKSKEKCVEIAQQLRELGINVECDVMSRPLAKQLEYVNTKGIKFSVVIGEKEMKSGVLKLRNMQSGSEKDIELRNLKRVLDVIRSV